METKRLCEVCANVTGMSGAGLMLMSDDVPRGPVCSSNKVSAIVEQLEYDLGEGPCLDAYRQDRPVLEPDLAEPATPSWPAFTGPAVEAGVRAVFAFPLQVGAVRLGALNLLHIEPGEMRQADIDVAHNIINGGLAVSALDHLTSAKPS